MKKFYAVLMGEYSDRHIVTITDSEENANRIAAAYDAYVEEYEDNIVNPIGVWYVTYHKYENGKTEWSAYGEDIDLYGEDDVKREPGSGKSRDSFWGSFHWWSAHVFGKDKEHAIKVGQDRYAQWKAEQEGIA